MGALPLELIELIVDELRSDYHDLRSCSLVCKSLVSRSSKHLFRSFRVPNPYYNHAALLHFCDSVLSSERMSTSIEVLDVTVDPSTLAKVALLLEHLPALQSLTVSATVLDRRAYPPATPSVKRHVEHLRIRAVPMDIVAYFLGGFASAGSLDIHRCTGKAGPVPHTYRVKRLAILGWDGPALREVSRLVEPSTLESILLDLPVNYPTPSAGDVNHFFHVLGAHIRELEYRMDPFFKEILLGTPALRACPLLKSFNITARREARFDHASWRAILGPLSSLPPGVRAVRLRTNCGALREAQDARDVLRTLDWNAVGRALQHLNTLEHLQIEACDFNCDSIDLARDRDVQDDILGKLPGHLRSRIVFK
ncbi:F-box protein [Phanerochaete sordida]|uniref:F-box protein n=1 Tax=Phanerochaete sordida TaxID=48140 RepID=A0A9P3GKW7_9APHY|nr:F-box protein [Phanerochaete sordida]